MAYAVSALLGLAALAVRFCGSAEESRSERKMRFGLLSCLEGASGFCQLAAIRRGGYWWLKLPLALVTLGSAFNSWCSAYPSPLDFDSERIAYEAKYGEGTFR